MSDALDNFELKSLTEENVGALQNLNIALFPVPYPKAMYSYLVRADACLNTLVFDKDVLIGAVSGRRDSDTLIYILTLGVVPTYRERGIGTKLLLRMLDSGRNLGVSRVYAHVQEGNEDALRLYRRAGFAVTGYAKNYYRHVEPPHAHVVEYALNDKNFTSRYKTR